MKTFLTFILSLLVTKQVFVNVTSILNKIADLTKWEIFTKIPIKQTLARTVRNIYSHITGYFLLGICCTNNTRNSLQTKIGRNKNIFMTCGNNRIKMPFITSGRTVWFWTDCVSIRNDFYLRKWIDWNQTWWNIVITFCIYITVNIDIISSVNQLRGSTEPRFSSFFTFLRTF